MVKREKFINAIINKDNMGLFRPKNPKLSWQEEFLNIILTSGQALVEALPGGSFATNFLQNRDYAKIKKTLDYMIKQGIDFQEFFDEQKHVNNFMIDAIERFYAGDANSFYDLTEIQKEHPMIFLPQMFDRTIDDILKDPRIGAEVINLHQLGDNDTIHLVRQIKNKFKLYRVPAKEFSIALSYSQKGKQKKKFTSLPVEQSSIIMPEQKLILPPHYQKTKNKARVSFNSNHIPKKVDSQNYVSTDNILSKGEKKLYNDSEEVPPMCSEDDNCYHEEHDYFFVTLPELIAARSKVHKSHLVWDSLAVHTEENIGFDHKGRFYSKHTPVAVIVNGGGIISEGIDKILYFYPSILKIKNYHTDLFDKLLDGKLPDGSSIELYSFEDIKKGVSNLPHKFGVVVPYSKVVNTATNLDFKENFMKNPLVIARNGGLNNLEEYFDRLEETMAEVYPYKGETVEVPGFVKITHVNGIPVEPLPPWRKRCFMANRHNLRTFDGTPQGYILSLNELKWVEENPPSSDYKCLVSDIIRGFSNEEESSKYTFLRVKKNS